MRLHLLSSVTFSSVISVLFSAPAFAITCTAAPDCLSLGYTLTASDCPKGYIKCPWNTSLVYCECSKDYQYACDGANETAGINKCGSKYKECNCANGYQWNNGSCSCGDEYKYTCTGSNETAGTNKCGGKYTACGCKSGYKWENGGCVENKCALGDIYYSDNTCSTAANYNNSKTVLGIVVHVANGGKHGQVMAPWPIDDNGNKCSNCGILWASKNIDVPNLPNYARKDAPKDYDSCGNTDIIVADGDANIYPAAWATRKYAPTTATKGKWCMPAAGIITNIFNNQDTIQTAFLKVGGIKFPSYYAWSSTEYPIYNDYSPYYAWGAGFSEDDGLTIYGKYNPGKESVRPVLEF